MNNKKTITTKSNKKIFVLSLVGLIFISLAVLFSLIGFFGATVTAKTAPLTENSSINPLTYFFKEGWEDVIQRDYANFKNLQAAYQMGFIIHFISYLCLIAGVLWSTIIMSQSWVAFAKHKSEDIKIASASKKLFLLAVPYVILSNLLLYSSAKGFDGERTIEISTTFGWGSILVIVSIAFAFVSDALSKYCNNDKIKLPGVVLENISPLLMLFVLIFGFGAIFGLGSEYGTNEYIGLWQAATSFSVSQSFSLWALYWFSFLAIIATVVMSMIVTSTKGKKSKVALYCVLLALAILGGIISKECINTLFQNAGVTGGKSLFGSAFIAQIIIFAICSGVSIADLVCSKNVSQKQKPIQKEQKRA